jgi:hypothetical protein
MRIKLPVHIDNQFPEAIVDSNNETILVAVNTKSLMAYAIALDTAGVLNQSLAERERDEREIDEAFLEANGFEWDNYRGAYMRHCEDSRSWSYWLIYHRTGCLQIGEWIVTEPKTQSQFMKLIQGLKPN